MKATLGNQALLGLALAMAAISIPFAASPAVASPQEPVSHWCVLTFRNVFHIPFSGCEGYSISWDASGSSDECDTTETECDFTISIVVTSDSTGGTWPEDAEGPLDCGSQDDATGVCIANNSDWLTIYAQCSVCQEIVE